jgi:hypothetical protein
MMVYGAEASAVLAADASGNMAAVKPVWVTRQR